MPLRRTRPARGCSRGAPLGLRDEQGRWLTGRSHLPLLFIGIEHLQLASSTLAEEYFRAAEAIDKSDPLLLNELGVVAYNREECAPPACWYRVSLIAATSRRWNASRARSRQPAICRA